MLTSSIDSNSKCLNISLKRIYWMALIRTLMVMTTVFERTKENYMVFGRLNKNIEYGVPLMKPTIIPLLNAAVFITVVFV